MAGELPSLALGSLETNGRCARRLASLLSPERRSAPTSEAAFRLVNEVMATLVTAHTLVDTTGCALDDVQALTDPTAPETLSVEERAVYVALTQQYLEAFGDRPGALDLRSGDNLRRDSATGLFALSGRADLVLRPPDGVPVLQRAHGREPRTSWADPGYAALLKIPVPAAHNDPMLRIRRIWAGPVAGASERTVTRADVENFRDDVAAMVLDARADPDHTTPGWWCMSCPAMLRCPAVAQLPFEDVVVRMTPMPPEAPPAGPSARSAGRSVMAASSPPPGAAAHDPTLGTRVQPAPGTLIVSATRMRVFEECPRQFFLRWVVNLQGDDTDPDGLAAAGSHVHRELHLRHLEAHRHDEAGPVDPEGSGDSWVLARALAHVDLCPREAADYLGGEADVRWLITRKAILVTGRIDALWRQPDGTIEVRDYKTGACPASLDDDVGAALYLLLAATALEQRPRRVRIVYESLSGEHPHLVTLEGTLNAFGRRITA